MSLSSCVKCWDSPCTCGHDYENSSNEYKIKLISAILGIGENDSLLDDIKQLLKVSKSC